MYGEGKLLFAVFLLSSSISRSTCKDIKFPLYTMFTLETHRAPTPNEILMGLPASQITWPWTNFRSLRNASK